MWARSDVALGVARMIHTGARSFLVVSVPAFTGGSAGDSLTLGREEFARNGQNSLSSWLLALPRDVLLTISSQVDRVREHGQSKRIDARFAVDVLSRIFSLSFFPFFSPEIKFPVTSLSLSFFFLLRARLESCVIARGGFGKKKNVQLTHVLAAHQSVRNPLSRSFSQRAFCFLLYSVVLYSVTIIEVERQLWTKRQLSHTRSSSC